MKHWQSQIYICTNEKRQLIRLVTYFLSHHHYIQAGYGRTVVTNLFVFANPFWTVKTPRTPRKSQFRFGSIIVQSSCDLMNVGSVINSYKMTFLENQSYYLCRNCVDFIFQGEFCNCPKVSLQILLFYRATVFCLVQITIVRQ